MQNWLALYGALAALGCAIAVLLTAALVRLAPRLGLVDDPSDEKFHRRSTPVGGGIAIFCGLLPLLLFAQTSYKLTWLVLGGCGFLAAVGLVDDLRHVPAAVKFLLLGLLTSVLWLFGIGAHPTGITLLDFAITLLWMTGVPSAFNAIDNMDGLATGVAAIASLTFVVIAIETRQWVFGAVSAALLGSLMGFLLWNFHPARIFMGDSGSFFLGFLLAALGVVGQWNYNPVIATVIPVLVLGLPIFDLVFTVLRRHVTGVTRTPLEALRHCAADHTSHRLVDLGLSVRGSVLLLYAVAAVLGLSAMTLRMARSIDAILHLIQAVLLIAASLPILILVEGRARARIASEGDPPVPVRIPLPWRGIGAGRWLVAGACLLAAALLLR